MPNPPSPMTRIIDPDSPLALFLWAGFVGSFALGSVGRQLIWPLGLLGLWQLLRHPREVLREPSVRHLWLLLLLMVVPGLLAQLDAFAFARSGRTLARLCWYGFAAIPLLMNPLGARHHRAFMTTSALVILFFVADGLVQYWTGSNLIGAPLFDDGRYALRITGFLGTDFGWVMACLSPFVLFAALQRDRHGGLFVVTVLLLLTATYLSGSRTSVLVLLVALFGIPVLVYCSNRGTDEGVATSANRQRAVFFMPVVGLVLVLMLVAGAGGARWHDVWGVLSNDPEGFNKALSLRPAIWREAWRVFSDHWVNGVGLRGFTDLAAPQLESIAGLPAKARGWSPHMAWLEVATSTGLIGLAAYLSAYCLFAWWLLRASASAHAAGLSALLVLFPLGSTLPLYSPRVAGMGWMMIVIALALDTHRRPLLRDKSLCAV